MLHVQTNTEKLQQKREFLKLVETLFGVGLQCQVAKDNKMKANGRKNYVMSLK